MSQKVLDSSGPSLLQTPVSLKKIKEITDKKISSTPESKIPSGPIDSKWEKHKMDSALINPAN